MKRLILLAGLLPLIGCGHKTAWEDRDYANDMDVAQTVFENGRMAQAEFKYKKAFDRSFLVNDAQAIHDAGFNLATTQVRQNHIAAALKTIDKTLQALENREFTQSDDLHLIRAAAFYREKNYRSSLQEARKAQASLDHDIQNKAVAFEGYNAAELNDDALLSSSIQILSRGDKEKNKADLLELETLSALSHHQWIQARTNAETLVIYRREADDNLAMRRALALQARAYRGNGQRQDAERIRQQIRDSEAQEEKLQ